MCHAWHGGATIHAHPCERSADNAEEASLKIPLPWLWELILISALLNFLWWVPAKMQGARLRSQQRLGILPRLLGITPSFNNVLAMIPQRFPYVFGLVGRDHGGCAWTVAASG